jgi:hypothetical protein
VRECSRPPQITPHDACLPISGDPFWLRMLVTEVVACYGAPEAAPTVRLENAAGRRSVRFFRPGFCAEQAGPLRMALIENIARLHGAEVASGPDGLTLHWPTEQLKRPETARRPEPPT